ncbi:MAG TPA: type II toxin-antitoxin system HicB family antitoxin [Gemmatimonadales bacterium]|nr:type II toxin-antitoxin system HicB family antitoxin [Gemmatimonadales bacterium]
MKVLMIVEETSTGYSAWSPDLPGCVATGRTRELVEARMASAAAMHLEGLRDAGESIPDSRVYVKAVEVEG